MSARPVVKTTFMDAPMQEAAILAAQVWRLSESLYVDRNGAISSVRQNWAEQYTAALHVDTQQIWTDELIVIFSFVIEPSNASLLFVFFYRMPFLASPQSKRLLVLSKPRSIRNIPRHGTVLLAVTSVVSWPMKLPSSYTFISDRWESVFLLRLNSSSNQKAYYTRWLFM